MEGAEEVSKFVIFNEKGVEELNFLIFPAWIISDDLFKSVF